MAALAFQLFVIILIIPFTFESTPPRKSAMVGYPEMETYLEAELAIIRSLLGKRKTIT